MQLKQVLQQERLQLAQQVVELREQQERLQLAQQVVEFVAQLHHQR
jgi:hypothetical protein